MRNIIRRFRSNSLENSATRATEIEKDLPIKRTIVMYHEEFESIIARETWNEMAAAFIDVHTHKQLLVFLDRFNLTLGKPKLLSQFVSEKTYPSTYEDINLFAVQHNATEFPIEMTVRTPGQETNQVIIMGYVYVPNPAVIR